MYKGISYIIMDAETTKPIKKRSELRECAFCLIFEHKFNPDVSCRELYDLAINLYGYANDAYVSTVFTGVCETEEELDALISKYSVGWKLDRLSNVSLAIMRLCLYESRYIEDVPVNVALNEAIELAKKYDTDAAPAFINGVLNAAVKGEGMV